MPKLNLAALKKALNSNDFKNIYYIYGSDIISVDAACRMLVKTFVRDGDEDYNLSCFDASQMDFSQLYEALERVPFFAEYNCVLIKDFNADALGAGVFPEFFKKLQALSFPSVVIISITGFDVLMGKKAPVKNNKKLMEYCEKSGVLCECAQKTSAELAEFGIKKCAKSGCNASKSDMMYLAELCLCDSAIFNNEIEKLTAFRLGGEITRSDIDTLTSKTLSADVFGVARAIGAFDVKKTFSLLDEVFEKNTDEIALAAALISAFVDLYRAKCALLSAKSAESCAADFDMKNRVFAVRNNMRDVKSLSKRRIANCLEILSALDCELKSTNADKRILIEKAITQMLMVKNEQ